MNKSMTANISGLPEASGGGTFLRDLLRHALACPLSSVNPVVWCVAAGGLKVAAHLLIGAWLAGTGAEEGAANPPWGRSL